KRVAARGNSPPGRGLMNAVGDVSWRGGIALFKRRVYLFSEDLKEHAYAEIMEERARRGLAIHRESESRMKKFIRGLKNGRKFDLSIDELADMESIDIQEELD